MSKIPGAETTDPQDTGADAAPGRSPSVVTPSTTDDRSTADRVASDLGALIGELDDDAAAARALPQPLAQQIDNQLVQVRLGTSSSLFVALRCKHAATADHALRVALTCSGWALKLELEESRRDVVEIAALLHDIGIIGTPDNILLKPGLLDSDEAAVMTRSRLMSLEILRHSCTSAEILEIVEHVPAWYNGARQGFRLKGARMPLGARMIAIAEAFDAMTTEHVYHSAMSQERALTELFDCAGSQFDPDVVRAFLQREQDFALLAQELADGPNQQSGSTSRLLSQCCK